MSILVVGLMSQVYIFIHYGIFPPKLKSVLFTVIEIFRFILFYLICLFYTTKSAGLLKNKKSKLIFLNIISVSGILVMIVFGTILGIKVYLY
jgi:hypothetical protein